MRGTFADCRCRGGPAVTMAPEGACCFLPGATTGVIDLREAAFSCCTADEEVKRPRSLSVDRVACNADERGVWLKVTACDVSDKEVVLVTFHRCIQV